jgi:hypothetical protein
VSICMTMKFRLEEASLAVYVVYIRDLFSKNECEYMHSTESHFCNYR